LILDCGSGF